MIHIRSTHNHKRDECQRLSKQFKHPQKHRTRHNSCIAFCRYGEQSGIKSQIVCIYPDRPTLKSGPSALHQNTSDYTPIPMEEDKTKEDNMLEEDLVDYGATPEQGMDVNLLYSQPIVLLSVTVNLSLLNSILVLKKLPSLSQKNWSTI
jgi:hypothetical protein